MAAGEGPALAQMRRRGQMGVATSMVWAIPLAISAAGHHLPPGRLAGAFALAAAFFALYAWLLLRRRDLGGLTRRPGLAAIAVLVAVAVAAMVVGGASTWDGLLVFTAVVAGWKLPLDDTPRVTLALALATGLVEAVAGAGADSGFGLGIITLSVGFLMLSWRRVLLAREELDDARQEIARLAVADERLRFARDLHDLLGHSLSVIALKSELAGRLLPDRPEPAAEQVRDIEAVTRRALAEVREAVSGYRQPTLAGELEGARTALGAAGIAVELAPAPPALPADLEAVLAWTVREGTTNVLRHAAARRVAIHVRAEAERASVEVLDDGAGADGALDGGTGLAGLAERVARARGRLEAAPQPGGGFRLAVSLPLDGTA